jgi:hypothetical protein
MTIKRYRKHPELIRSGKGFISDSEANKARKKVLKARAKRKHK